MFIFTPNFTTKYILVIFSLIFKVYCYKSRKKPTFKILISIYLSIGINFIVVFSIQNNIQNS